jgi:hypothetical protein
VAFNLSTQHSLLSASFKEAYMPNLKHKIIILSAVWVLTVLACNTPGLSGTPTPQPTGQSAPTPDLSATPTAPPEEGGQKHLLVQLPSKEIVAIDPDGQSSPFASPGFLISNGPHFPVGIANNVLYGISVDDPSQPRAYAVDASGARPLEFISERTRTLTVWPGDGTLPPSIAWEDTDWQQSPPFSTLWLAPVDGVDVVKVAELSTPEGNYLVPVRFSADGQRLYYSQEPSGLGGYILFDGYSSLFVYNQADNTSQELIPFSTDFICIDDLSPDEQLVAHHCGAEGGTGIRNIQTGETTSISLPAEVASEVGSTGSARFSPDGRRLAFALARNNPDGEQGWVAVTDDLSGPSRIAATAPTGQYYTVPGWLDNNTLILQTYGQTPVVWLLGLDGTGWQRDGTFLGMLDR